MTQIRPSKLRHLIIIGVFLAIGCYVLVRVVSSPKVETLRPADRTHHQDKRDNILDYVGKGGPFAGYDRDENDDIPRPGRGSRQRGGGNSGGNRGSNNRGGRGNSRTGSRPSRGRTTADDDDDDDYNNNIYGDFDDFDFDGLLNDESDEFADEDTYYYYDDGRPDSCPEYGRFASMPHYPLSQGPLRLPYQRPVQACRTFRSQAVEDLIAKFNKELSDLDLGRLFENCFPNTLDTTIRWHYNGSTPIPPRTPNSSPSIQSSPQTFIVTGDINAEWLRDSHRQLLPYIRLAPQDPALKTLILGAINTQALFVSQYPYCNAFHPPPDSRIPVVRNNMDDVVFPSVDLRVVFECKYELDSLGSFLALSNEYFKATKDTSFVNPQWLKALDRLLTVLDEQSQPTYSDSGRGTASIPKYTFQRRTTSGTETLNLGGMGNPVNANISLVRSAFRPSDDATIYQYFIPANAQIAVELKRASELMAASGHHDLIHKLYSLGGNIEGAIWQHGVYHHKVFGDVFAYEVDGYGGVVSLDDANLPSLLSLPILGFVDKNHPIYQNTRRMILSKQGNPYYLTGRWFSGIGGPHIGVHNAWPMSLLAAIRSSDNDDEIESLLEIIKKSTAGLGLMHESVNVDIPFSYTRSWFAWANSEFAQTILDIAERKPYLIFEDDSPRISHSGSDKNQNPEILHLGKNNNNQERQRNQQPLQARRDLH